MRYSHERRPVWAGVAVRMDDGTVLAFELAGDLEASITVTREEDDITLTSDAYRRYRTSADSTVDIRVTGRARNWAGFYQNRPSTPEEIEPARKAIEA